MSRPGGAAHCPPRRTTDAFAAGRTARHTPLRRRATRQCGHGFGYGHSRRGAKGRTAAGAGSHLRGGGRVVRLPHHAADRQVRLVAHEKPHDGPSPRDPRSVEAAAARRRTRRRGFAQRCVPRGRDRRAAPLPRKAQRRGWGLSCGHADQSAHRRRRDWRKPGHDDAVRRAGRPRRPGAANRRDPSPGHKATRRALAALHATDRRCVERVPALVRSERFCAASILWPATFPVSQFLYVLVEPACGWRTVSARRSVRR